MNQRSWTFPLPRTHTGVPLGNGHLGAMVWGSENTLRITLGLTDLWDHRGGMSWTEQQSYANIRSCLEKGDEVRLRRLFEDGQDAPGASRRPSVIPLGRVDLQLPHGCTLAAVLLEERNGFAEVKIRGPEAAGRVRVGVDPERDVVVVHGAGCSGFTVRGVPAWKAAGDTLPTRGFELPTVIDSGDSGGWIQPFPADPAVCVAWRCNEEDLLIVTARGDGRQEARRAAEENLGGAVREVVETSEKRTHTWWNGYWQAVPRVSIPNETLQFLYDYGMYKFGAFSNPRGVAGGLQGPWIEEYALPPWSADYHFNINVQMCYWPAYRGNRLHHLAPLWELIGSWHERMVHNARMFVGIDDGYMLPHAVDDRCRAMGGFWSGAVDHGCTAWVARMMFRYYTYTMDKDFLRHTAWPFMVRSMRVYEAMLERLPDGRYRLPVSVSPEYRGNRLDAWGANASFQLAAIHRLVEDLLEAARVLGEEPAETWQAIAAGLPHATLCTWQGPDTAVFEHHPDPYTVIGLWEGQPLEESHRHHSHLAGIFPFDTIDPFDSEWTTVVGNTYKQWVFHGTGLWSGWCIPWAAILHSRVGNGRMAELLLEAFDRLFTNEGNNSVHDAHFPGFSLLGAPPFASGRSEQHPERMQVEACMAAATAVQEMLLCTRRGINYVFPGIPGTWSDVSFEGMRTEGAFLVSATREAGHTTEVRVHSLAGGVFRMGNPFGRSVRVQRSGENEVLEGAVVALRLGEGEKANLRPAA